ncbi:helix-turn-helix transcriptional regulator [Kitasatospora sp. NPDC002551]|uniref:helix-turn-helix transcriptional regulator n=1 Tax=Kitasatospora sp. NPDC002551 TaxID=3154539 RepID=UPI0033276551
MTRQENDAEQRRDLGARIRSARRAAGHSQGRIAAVLRVPRSAVSDIEHGRRGLDAVELRRLAAELGVTADWLLGCDDPGPFAALHPADQRSAELYAGYLLWRRTPTT